MKKHYDFSKMKGERNPYLSRNLAVFSENLTTSDPYQWFFPLGIVLGILGTALWIVFPNGGLHEYPGLLHSALMSGGFFLMISVGFLMTAIPRFTGTASASAGEKIMVLLPWIGLAIFPQPLRILHGIVVAELLLLCVFGARRIVKSSQNPPPPFILVGIGLLSGLSGAIIAAGHDYEAFDASLVFFGHQLFIYGLFYALMLGVGTQLLPMLMGTRTSHRSDCHLPASLQSAAWQFRRYRIFLGYGVILIGSFVVESYVSIKGGGWIRNLLVSVVVLRHWGLSRRPSQSVLAWCLWIASWMFLLGGWVAVIAPAYRVHGMHILFIGSLSMMIFAVATRVVLAHGQHDLRQERTSKSLLFTGIFLLIALLTRVAAPLTSDYFQHLSYASMMWIAAAVCWMTGFLPKLVVRRRTPSTAPTPPATLPER